MLFVTAAVVAGCSRSQEQPSHPLASVLIDDGPSGFEPVDGPASGPMDAAAASEASAADPTKKRLFLQRSGYQEGYSRVFRSGEDYVMFLAHEFSSSRGAARLVSFEVDQVREKIGTALFDVPEIEGAKGYIISGVKRKGLTGLFCQAVWFALGTRAFGVTSCGAQPDSSATARRFAQTQYERANA